MVSTNAVTNPEGVIRAVKKLMEAMFKLMYEHKVLPPAMGVHYYVEGKAEMFQVQEGGKDVIRKQLEATVTRNGLIGSAYISRGDHNGVACFVASVNLPDRGLTLLLPIGLNKKDGALTALPVQQLEDLEIPGNLGGEGTLN